MPINRLLIKCKILLKKTSAANTLAMHRVAKFLFEHAALPGNAQAS